ncbi:MAG: hypothetical protein KDA28_01030, partial [Phycisphaerales bacterium]|nr:hypothetical protein [Phycisphaerales bacterium]
DADTDAPIPVIYRYYDTACSINGALSPGPGEEGHWVAGRITPDVTPFDLYQVKTHVWQTTGCDATQSFEMAVYVESDIAPPATPTPVATWTHPAITTPGNRELAGVLPSMVTVQPGEHVYVALQLPSQSACVVTCPDNTHTDRDYWSNSASTPFAWTTFESFGINDDLLVEADGFIAP